MTPLGHLLIERIREGGPITVADYMADCLLHPVHGYYTTRDPFGTAGDFTTAPEISQMFGELIGLALAQAWLDQGAPAPFTLAELGPGRGTLMADVLRATAGRSGLSRRRPRGAGRSLAPVARGARRRRWPPSVPMSDGPTRSTTCPTAPLFLVANEFLDALPIRQFQRGADGWRERLVGLPKGNWPLACPICWRSARHPRLPDTAPGTVVEDCAPARHVVAALAARIARHGGACLPDRLWRLALAGRHAAGPARPCL